MVSEEVKPNGHLGTHVHQESEKTQLKVKDWNRQMVGVDCKTTRPHFPGEKGKVGGMGGNRQTGTDLQPLSPSVSRSQFLIMSPLYSSLVKGSLCLE